MKNKISIDELVRQSVANGEEPHNLGAWANMERMLDGKDPYKKEEEDSRRKPWLFMLLGLIICSTAVIGGYNYLSDNNSAKNNMTVSPSGNDNADLAKESNALVSNSINTDQLTASASNTQKVNNIANNSTSQTITNTNSTDNIRNNKLNNIGNNISSNISNNNKQLNLSNNNIRKIKTKSLSPVATNMAHAVKNSNSPKNITPNDNKVAITNITKEKIKNVEPTIIEKFLDTTNVTRVTQRITKDENGNKAYVTDSFKFKIVEEKERIVVNPRFIELTAEQEKAAQRKTTLASNTQTIRKPTMDAINVSEQQENSVSLAPNKELESKKRGGFFSIFKHAAQKLNQKSIAVAHTPVPIYTAMFVGVNAALINSKHNFGGFQGGLTAMTPLSRLFTLQAEARFIHKNNSGYTVTDQRSEIKSTSVDSTSWVHGKIYNYEMDSISKGYNLKNFYTLQVPVILQANLNKFSAYGGIHLNYGFRMNINSVQNSNPLSLSDTVYSTSNYTKRTNTEAQFNRDDFGSRLGLGYTVGGSYDFNSKLYLDLRMSNLFWDNTKGAAKQEISDVFFKIPSFQLSVGYRFRKFDKEKR